jgi:hypothetical protein
VGHDARAHERSWLRDALAPEVANVTITDAKFTALTKVGKQRPPDALPAESSLTNIWICRDECALMPMSVCLAQPGARGHTR